MIEKLNLRILESNRDNCVSFWDNSGLLDCCQWSHKLWYKNFKLFSFFDEIEKICPAPKLLDANNNNFSNL